MKNLIFKLNFFLLFFVFLYAETSGIENAEDEIYDGKKTLTSNDEIIPLVSFEQIPDSSLIRKEIAKTWFLNSPEQVVSQNFQIQTDTKGNRFKLRSVHLKEKNLLAVVISPIDTEFSNIEKVPQGTWILYRNYTTGEPVCIKIYPRENPELYLMLRPSVKDSEKGKSFIDICLFNAYVRKNIAVGVPFESLYYLSLLELRKTTEAVLPWEIFNPPVTYSGVESASDIVAERLYKLVYLEDGGFDENGVPVHLKDGKVQTDTEIIAAIKPEQKLKDIIGGVNCSGFVKWIIDGMIKPVAGQGTFIKSLLTPTDVPDTHFTQPYENQDLYFGLEWIRNLAAAALTLNTKRTVFPIGSGVDVTVEPFALVPPIKSIEAQDEFAVFKGYEKNAGYQTNYLQALLYYLAVKEPGHFYLGAVSRDKGTPVLRRYHHVAAFFPYFDILGNFHLDVYESGEKTSIEEFTKRNKDAFTALVRVRAPQEGVFSP
ncbi:hypothetical protein [Treponema pedis]|uniref:Uncharacterized protein n=1 Tax=Treponema pedis str. T A4 TaxID=1291379 RepID=S5ZP83_9SPIR|nr:hypothetical protein [Treponema pedis]AGT44427.1 hypothetical protein TPE_1953 [Treponema pedis str. T A4]